jgi:chromosome segregation ATPase
MHKHASIGFLLLAVLAVSGCAGAGGDCDPSRGGLFGGISCDASGGYDRRIAARQDEQAALAKRNAELTQERAAIEAERRDVARTLEAKEAERAKAEKQLADVRRKLGAGQQRNRTLQGEAKKLEADIRQNEADVARLKKTDDTKAVRLAELKREEERLAKEYEAYTGR